MINELEEIKAENAKMRHLLKQIVEEYGKRDVFGELFYQGRQSYLIGLAMDLAGVEGVKLTGGDV